MSLVVTGASGHLGRLTVQALLDRGVEPSRIVAMARTPERLDDLATLGVDVRRADYSDPQSLKEAFLGAERCCSSLRARSERASTSTATSSTQPAKRAST